VCQSLIPGNHHIARHLSPSLVDGDRATSANFLLREEDSGALSTYELEHFGQLSQVAAIKALVECLISASENKKPAGRKIRKSHGFGVLQVEAAIACVSPFVITIVADPQEEVECHSLINFPGEISSADAEIIAIKLAAKCPTPFIRAEAVMA
jgi:hypothetical protein